MGRQQIDDTTRERVGRLTVGARACTARPLQGSATGSASGLCVLARTVREVVDAAYWMPGRVLVLADAAVSKGSALLVGRSARMATFAAVVVLSEEGMDLTDLEEITSPIPMVVADRASDQEWIRHAVRIAVEVNGPSASAPDLRTRRPERRHRGGVCLAVPGTVAGPTGASGFPGPSGAERPALSALSARH